MAAAAPLVPNVAEGEAALSTTLGPDDYEEGRWTPLLMDGSGKVYATGVGFYTKVGGLVTVTLTATFEATSPTAITNLPLISS